MKVEALIKFLQNFDPNKPVGFVDHFGNFIPLEEKHLSLTRIIGWKPTKSAVVPQGDWQSLMITPPDIGEEPD